MSAHAPDIRAGAVRAGAPGRGHLFVAAGGGGDVLAASIMQRMLYGEGSLPFIVTYSWDRLMVDPLPGPRGPSCFERIAPFGDHNFVVSADSVVRPPGKSLLPRLARELSRSFFLLDPCRGASGMRVQLAELVRRLGVEHVSLVDSGGDILATGSEPELRSPLVDSLVLAAADSIDASVDVLVTGAGLDGELRPRHVCDLVVKLGGDLNWRQLDFEDVQQFHPMLRWHPSEVNGLLIAAAMGFSGTVEIRDAALRVQVDRSSAAVHRCAYDAAIAHNFLAKTLVDSKSLDDAEQVMVATNNHSEINYQRKNAKRYDGKSPGAHEIAQRIAVLEYYADTREGVDALTLRRAAEVMGIRQEEMEALAPKLQAKFKRRFAPPLLMLT